MRLLGAGGLGRWGALAVGLGVSHRGKVGVVVSQLGLGLGLPGSDPLSAALAAVVLTTVVAPFLLNAVVSRAASAKRSS